MSNDVLRQSAARAAATENTRQEYVWEMAYKEADKSVFYLAESGPLCGPSPASQLPQG
jgi:hypothetical protein